jgi:hypothetical protein
VPLLVSAADRIEAQRELPADVLEGLFDAELFRMTLPRFLGGAELPIPALAEVAETIATGDASTAWCLGQALGCAMSAAYLDEAPASQVFGPRDAVLAWGAGAEGRVGRRRRGQGRRGGGRVPGQWTLGIRQRRQARHLARRALPGVRDRRQPAPRRRRRACQSHGAIPAFGGSDRR